MTSRVITAINVNEAFSQGLWHLKTAGQLEETRNGKCLVAPGPVITEYIRPTERVLWDDRRDANPVFHLMEAIWMLAGRNDAGFVSVFNKRMSEYAESDGNIHGAYGHRWTQHFNVNQVEHAIFELSENPNSRRVVIGMWDPRTDLDNTKRDLPCNTHIYFDLRGGKLNMTVCCRSNDLLWGAYGANVVHFSILQELIAQALKAPVGVYRQFSNNFHAYVDNLQMRELLSAPPTYDREEDPYSRISLHLPLLSGSELFRDFVDDCVRMTAGGTDFKTEFFNKVASPLMHHYIGRKMGENSPMVVGYDWGLAYSKWLQRRGK